MNKINCHENIHPSVVLWKKDPDITEMEKKLQLLFINIYEY